MSALVVALVLIFAFGRKLGHLVAAPPSDEQCQLLLDKYLDHASRARGQDVGERSIAEAQQASRGTVVRETDLTSCRAQLTVEQVECGLASPNVDAFERCMQP